MWHHHSVSEIYLISDVHCILRYWDKRAGIRFAMNSLFQSTSGVPALLIYKGGELIGNFVRLSDELGEDFYVTDIEGFLHE